MSLIKYNDEAKGRHQGQELHFDRWDLDGLPYNGPTNVLLREQEFEEATSVCYDGDVRQFDVTDEKQRQELATIIDRYYNGWYGILFCEKQMVTQPDGSVKSYVLIAWGKPYRQYDTRRAASMGIGQL